MAAQDPAEPFDLVDRDGRPLGVAKPRALVHRDGDWHRSVHLWVVLRGPAGDRVLLQRRSAAKDTHPSKVDVSVAGHLRAGESVEDGFREAEEEVGLRVRAADCVRLGTRRSVLVTPSVHDREVQGVYLAVTGETFEALRPDPDEVAALLAVALDDFIALLERGVAVRALELSRHGVREVTLGREELVPHGDGYFLRAARSIAARLRGDADGRWELG